MLQRPATEIHKFYQVAAGMLQSLYNISHYFHSSNGKGTLQENKALIATCIGIAGKKQT